jgi:hypothetical protein
LAKEGIAFEALDNGVLSCADPVRLQQILNELDATKIEAPGCKWRSRLPDPFTAADHAAGFNPIRTETTSNNTHDFGVGRSLTPLPALRAIGFNANRRLLEVETLSQDCTLAEGVFDQVTHPQICNDQRVAGLRFDDARVLALLHPVPVPGAARGVPQRLHAGLHGATPRRPRRRLSRRSHDL